jgi:hypothetical protein
MRTVEPTWVADNGRDPSLSREFTDEDGCPDF